MFVVKKLTNLAILRLGERDRKAFVNFLYQEFFKYIYKLKKGIINMAKIKAGKKSKKGDIP